VPHELFSCHWFIYKQAQTVGQVVELCVVEILQVDLNQIIGPW